MGIFSDVWKKLAGPEAESAPEDADQEGTGRLASLAHDVLDQAEAALAQRERELQEENGGFVLPSTEIQDPEWLQAVRDTEAAHRERRMKSSTRSPENSVPVSEATDAEELQVNEVRKLEELDEKAFPPQHSIA